MFRGATIAGPIMGGAGAERVQSSSATLADGRGEKPDGCGSPGTGVAPGSIRMAVGPGETAVALEGGVRDSPGSGINSVSSGFGSGHSSSESDHCGSALAADSSSSRRNKDSPPDSPTDWSESLLHPGEAKRHAPTSGRANAKRRGRGTRTGSISDESSQIVRLPWCGRVAELGIRPQASSWAGGGEPRRRIRPASHAPVTDV